MAASWFEAESRKLPTPQELVQSKSQQFAATVIPVDTSGSTIKRLSDTRKNELYAEICKPKLRSSTSPLLNQTVPITTTTIKSISAEDRLAQSKWKRKSYAGYARPRLPPTPESSDSWLQALPKSTKEKRKSLEITTTTTTVGNETEYEWSDDPLPHSNTFSNRRKTFNHSITQFLSLRRPKKEKNSMVPPSIPPKKQQNCQPDLNHQSHSSLETDSSASQPEAKNIGSSFKRFLFRSVSLRQPRKTPMKKRLSPDFSEELLYENYTPHCHNRNLQSCGSSSIPEYANFEVSSHFQLAPPTTQVLQVTNRLRNRLDSATTITSPGSSLVDETNWQQAKMTGGNGEGSKKYRVLAVAPRISDKVKLNSLQKSKRHLTSVSSYGSNTSLDWNR